MMDDSLFLNALAHRSNNLFITITETGRFIILLVSIFMFLFNQRLFWFPTFVLCNVLCELVVLENFKLILEGLWCVLQGFFWVGIFFPSGIDSPGTELIDYRHSFFFLDYITYRLKKITSNLCCLLNRHLIIVLDRNFIPSLLYNITAVIRRFQKITI